MRSESQDIYSTSLAFYNKSLPGPQEEGAWRREVANSTPLFLPWEIPWTVVHVVAKELEHNLVTGTTIGGTEVFQADTPS